MSRPQLLAIMLEPGCFGHLLCRDIVGLVRLLVEKDEQFYLTIDITLKRYNFDRVIDFTLLQRLRPDERLGVIEQQPAAILSIPPFERSLVEMEVSINRRPSLIICHPARHHHHLVTLNPDALEFLTGRQTDAMCLDAVRVAGRALRYVDRKTPAICAAAVTQCGLALEHVPFAMRTDELQMVAVKQNAHALYFCVVKTHALCMAAVNGDGRALRYIKDPSEEIVRAAIRNDCNAISLVKNPSNAFIDEALSWNGRTWLSLTEKQRNRRRYELAVVHCDCKLPPY